MKLRNKKTDRVLTKYSIRTLEGVDADKGTESIVLIDDETDDKWYYDTLADFNEEWEDYEEPIEFWTIDIVRMKVTHVYEQRHFRIVSDEQIANIEGLGLKFETEEEAEKALEKLKAWKRLKDKGFKFKDWRRDMCEVSIKAEIHDEGVIGMIDDLNILFGGEE